MRIREVDYVQSIIRNDRMIIICISLINSLLWYEITFILQNLAGNCVLTVPHPLDIWWGTRPRVRTKVYATEDNYSPHPTYVRSSVSSPHPSY